MASTEPLGFTSSDMPGTPSSPTYCVATCPAAIICASSSSDATKRPSPWEIAMLWTSPTSHLESHGESVEATRVRTRRLWWRPIVLNVSVGQVSSVSRMSPYGTRPSFTSAWKPLQMPSIRPSRACSRSRTASVTSGARKNAVMNFAEPSGSSPPEKPPGIMTIWLSRMRRASSCVLSATASGVRLLTTKTSAFAPARSKARAVSYSQLVPGNTGMTTRGRATWTAGVGREEPALAASNETASTRSP